jgi:hypothetical protein
MRARTATQYVDNVLQRDGRVLYAEVMRAMRTQFPPFMDWEVDKDLNQGALEASWPPRSP